MVYVSSSVFLTPLPAPLCWSFYDLQTQGPRRHAMVRLPR